MNPQQKLTAIKILHTAIWIFFNIVIFYLGYAVFTNAIDKWAWICLSFIILEGIVLLVFKNVCPVTLVARNYSLSQKANFDIYLPNWLAKRNKEIYGVIVLIIVASLIYKVIFN